MDELSKTTLRVIDICASLDIFYTEKNLYVKERTSFGWFIITSFRKSYKCLIERLMI